MLSLALTFFLIANPIGNTPAIIALVKDFDFHKQRMILLREGLIALLLALFFQYLGEAFLGSLRIQDYAVTITGGALLLIVAFDMIFAHHASESAQKKKEPYFVPIATPLLSGPGLLAVIMLKSKLEESNLLVSISILIAWVGVFAVLLAAPHLQKFMGKRGLAVLERIMGMILALIGIEMLIQGTILFTKTLG